MRKLDFALKVICLGSRPIQGYDAELPVFGVTLDNPALD
jgi:hypothetical protein